MITKIPFLCWQSPDTRLGPTQVSKEVWLVRIASFDYIWDRDAIIQQTTWMADCDMVSEEHTFDSEQEALSYIKAWWAKQ